MGANPLQVREQVLLLPLEVGPGGAVHFGTSKSLTLEPGPLSGTALRGVGWHAPLRSSCLLSVSAAFVASSRATSSLSCWLKKSVFVADFILVAGCAAVSTGGSRHPMVANFAEFFKKRKKIFKSHRCLMGRRKKVAWEAATKGRMSHTVGRSTARLLGGSGHVLSSKREGHGARSSSLSVFLL